MTPPASGPARLPVPASPPVVPVAGPSGDSPAAPAATGRRHGLTIQTSGLQARRPHHSPRMDKRLVPLAQTPAAQPPLRNRSASLPASVAGPAAQHVADPVADPVADAPPAPAAQAAAPATDPRSQLIDALGHLEAGDVAGHARLFDRFCALALEGVHAGRPLLDDARQLVLRMGGVFLDDPRVAALGAAWARAMDQAVGRGGDAVLVRLVAGFIKGLDPDHGSRAWSVREMVAGVFRQLGKPDAVEPDRRRYVFWAVSLLEQALGRVQAPEGDPLEDLLLLAPPHAQLAREDARRRLDGPLAASLMASACEHVASRCNPPGGAVGLAERYLLKIGRAADASRIEACCLLALEDGTGAQPARLDAGVRAACRIAARAGWASNRIWELLGRVTRGWSPIQRTLAGAACAKALATTHPLAAHGAAPPLGLGLDLHRGWAVSWRALAALEDLSLAPPARAVLFESLLRLPSMWPDRVPEARLLAEDRLHGVLGRTLAPESRRPALAALFLHGAQLLPLSAWPSARKPLLESLRRGQSVREVLPTLLQVYDQMPRAHTGGVPVTRAQVAEALARELEAIRRQKPDDPRLLAALIARLDAIARRVPVTSGTEAARLPGR